MAPSWAAASCCAVGSCHAACSSHWSFCLFPSFLQNTDPHSSSRPSGTIASLMSSLVVGPLCERTMLPFLLQISGQGSLFQPLVRSSALLNVWGWGRRQGTSKAPEMMAAKMVDALDILRKLHAGPGGKVRFPTCQSWAL